MVCSSSLGQILVALGKSMVSCGRWQVVVATETLHTKLLDMYREKQNTAIRQVMLQKHERILQYYDLQYYDFNIVAPALLCQKFVI